MVILVIDMLSIIELHDNEIVQEIWLSKSYIEAHIEAHSNHLTTSKRVDTLICHTTMRRNPINFLYNLGHVTL